MADEIFYMLGVIGVGFLVNYTLRALPFILFSGRDRALPVWVEKLGGVISPVIIALLIVYAYSGSAWKTPWPYLAGAVTVCLQVWKRNPLLSIVTGTVLYMVLLNCCGCATRTVRDLDGSRPELQLRSDGVYMGTARLEANEIVEALEEAEIPKTQAIHIKMERDLKDLRASSALMALLAKGGYTRSVLVTEQHGSSDNKSGNKYAGNERMRRQDDVFFYVTREGVRFGLLTPVGPDDVVKCLQKCNVRPDQQIRLCGKAEDFESKEVRDIMDLLEKVLRDASYVNVKRFWMTDGKTAPVVRPSRALPSQGVRTVPARTSSTAANGIRYKSASED